MCTFLPSPASYIGGVDPDSFIVNNLWYVVNSSTEDFFKILRPYSHSRGTGLIGGFYYAPRHDTFTGVLVAPNPKPTRHIFASNARINVTIPKTELPDLLKGYVWVRRKEWKEWK